MSTNRTVIPSARRLMASLRDIGYNAPAAIADLIDNSIDADARRVDVTVAREGIESWIRVADDGIGMTPPELDEAMRYGSHREYRPHDLGHFGLGMKTASLSQCRRLTVASRTTHRGRVHARRWDLDRIAQRDAWELEGLTPRICPDQLIAPLRVRPGTVVLWENLDRVVTYARPNGAFAMRAVEQLEREIADHLSMVFHRFLAGEVRRGRARLRININGTPLAAWDPFARDEPGTQPLEEQFVSIRAGGRSRRIRVQPYILPAQIQFSSPDAHLRAAGPRRWNRQQGLYIYRRGRMIQSGGWNRLRTLDEHSKLARIAIEIPPAAESAFQINVSKMSIVLPPAVRPALSVVTSGVVGRAQDAYRQRVRLVEPRNEPPEASDGEGVWQLGAHWDLIVRVLESELGDQPDLLRRVLLGLANAHSPRVEPATAS